jgi:ABC-type sugar transport system substrate-binding protein
MNRVQREEFRRIEAWVIDPSNTLAIERACSKYPAKRVNAVAIIRAITAYEPWPDDGIIDFDRMREFLRPFKNGASLGPSTLNNHAVVVREIIAAACSDIPFGWGLHLESREVEGLYRLYRIEQDGNPFDRVCLLTVEWHDEYIDEMIRGFVSMGEALGMLPDVIRVTDHGQIPRAVLDLINAYRGRNVSLAMPLAVTGRVRDWIDENIELIDERHRGFEQILSEYRMSMPITSVGYDRSYVRLNNQKVGEIMGGCVVADALEAGRKSGTVVVIGTETVGDGDPFARRQRYFIQRLRNAGDGFLVKKTADVSLESHRTGAPRKGEISRDELFTLDAGRKAEEALSRMLEEDREHREIFAVYAHTTTMADGVLRGLRAFGRTRDIGVYVDYLSAPILKLLADPTSPVKASICVDPYHYGRLIFRVAACRKLAGERESCDPILPTILTKKDVLDRIRVHPYGNQSAGICYMAELPNYFPDQDIGLEDSRYVWTDWMAKRLGTAFGPLILQRRREKLARSKSQGDLLPATR